MLGFGRASVLEGLAIPRTTTEHLSRLRRAGLVEPHRSGRSVFYRPSREGEQLIELFNDRK